MPCTIHFLINSVKDSTSPIAWNGDRIWVSFWLFECLLTPHHTPSPSDLVDQHFYNWNHEWCKRKITRCFHMTCGLQVWDSAFVWYCHQKDNWLEDGKDEKFHPLWSSCNHPKKSLQVDTSQLVLWWYIHAGTHQKKVVFNVVAAIVLFTFSDSVGKEVLCCTCNIFKVLISFNNWKVFHFV